MRFFTEELYKKRQLFSFPLADGLSLQDIEKEFEMDLDDFILQELLARDEWYIKYLPEALRKKLFRANGEVIFEHAEEALLKEIMAFRESIEKQWEYLELQIAQTKRQIAQTAAPELKEFLQMDFTDSEIKQVKGLDTEEIQILLYPAWDYSQKVYLNFTGVKESWMGKMHHDDANWWLLDELAVDEERAHWYQLRVLFGNADYVGQLQISFQNIQVRIEQDIDIEYDTSI